ncbi:lysine 5,6-aminomutase reactivase subunit KamB [Labilibaculum euxinus]
MPFLNDIENYKSLSIVGLEKNTGKTECLNYVLSRLRDSRKQIALTSIGIDGESCDQVTQTNKPEIELSEGMIFVTSELHYKQRKLISEVIDVSRQSTSLGRLVSAKVLSKGKVLLSGPVSNHSIKELIADLKNKGVELCIVDGALSRKSIGSPAVTEAMILATGAALSANITQLVYKTKYVYDLIQLPEIEMNLKAQLSEVDNGIWAIDSEGKFQDTGISSVLLIQKEKDKLFQHGNSFFVSGAVTDQFLDFLKNQKQISEIELIVRDFTRVFANPETYYAFVKRGGRIQVLNKTNLLAITINPVSPDGYRLNSDELKSALQDKVNVPVYDIKRL